MVKAGWLEGYVGGFCEKLPENILVSSYVNASWPKIDLPLAKAKPARGDGSREKTAPE